jgi:DNA-binding transcriptional MerR regulator
LTVLPPDRDLAPADEPRRGIKSAGAFRTISEVADELAVPQHVLRFWESKFSQIRPLKRGGGRRYYRPEDVELLRRVAQLLYQEGYTIRGAQRLLRTGSAKSDPATADQTLPFELEPPPADPAEERPHGRVTQRPRERIEPIADPAARALLRSILDELEDLRHLLPHKTR